jgi:hypothetical protein
MLYMLMINYDPARDPTENRNRQPEHAALEQEMRKDGKFEGGAGLYPVEAATMVRHEGDQAIVTDGPFPESKEALGGFFVVDCETKDEALDYAKRISIGDNAWIDMRPIFLWHPK